MASPCIRGRTSAFRELLQEVLELFVPLDFSEAFVESFRKVVLLEEVSSRILERTADGDLDLVATSFSNIEKHLFVFVPDCFLRGVQSI